MSTEERGDWGAGRPGLTKQLEVNTCLFGISESVLSMIGVKFNKHIQESLFCRALLEWEFSRNPFQAPT